MGAQTFHLDGDSAFQPVLRTAACPIVFHRPEEGTVGIVAVLCQCQILYDHAQGGGINRNKANFTPLAVNPKMHDAFTRLKILSFMRNPQSSSEAGEGRQREGSPRI
jgi:hypothetical protein